MASSARREWIGLRGWVLVATTMVAFWRIRPLAGILLLPYLLWVGFATALTFAVWRLNPGLLG
jgi:tryptophan-rich sensory protein